MKSYETILTSIGCSTKQIEIFVVLRQYGAKPASQIAKLIGAERTHTYKMLQQMVGRGIVAQSAQHGAQSFSIPSETVLDQYYATQQSLISQAQKNIPAAYAELAQLDTHSVGYQPLYRIWEGHEGMKQMFDVMQSQLAADGIRVIKMISMSTLENTARTPKTLQSYAQGFFAYCVEHGVSIQTTLATGIMIPETVITVGTLQELANLPAGQSSLYVIIIGTSTYFLVFKSVPVGFKRELVELADLFHLVSKVLAV